MNGNALVKIDEVKKYYPVTAGVFSRIVDHVKAVDGVDLLPCLSPQGPLPHDRLFWRFGEQAAIRMGDWKLLRMGTGPELYNLADDIGEKSNLAAKNPEKLKELKDDLEKWESKLAQPLWKRQAKPKPAARARRKAAPAKAI